MADHDKLAKLMIKATKSGNLAAAKALLDTDPTLVHATEADGSTPLHCAAWKGLAEMTALLIERGADVNAKSTNEHYGDTPLHAAAHGNQKDVARVLIAGGADVNAVSLNGRTPLDETGIHNATAVRKLLIEHGAIEAKD